MGLKIVLLGGPGAGKGTQAARLAKERSLVHISTGEIFRSHLKNGTEIGKRVKDFLDAGQLVPDVVTCEIVAGRTAEPDCADGYILDGFPRSLPQAEALNAALGAKNETLDAAIDISVPDEEIVGRLTARRFCEKCGAIYNLKTSPSAKGPDLCDREGCAGRLLLRGDDKEETINERLRVYHTTTEPILGYYEERGLLKSVAASGAGPDEVYAKIEEILSALETA